MINENHLKIAKLCVTEIEDMQNIIIDKCKLKMK